MVDAWMRRDGDRKAVSSYQCSLAAIHDRTEPSLVLRRAKNGKKDLLCGALKRIVRAWKEDEEESGRNENITRHNMRNTLECGSRR